MAVEGRWGFGMSGPEDRNRQIIDDQFRRMVIVKKAKKLFILSTVLTWCIFISLSVTLFYVGPLIHPITASDICPVDDRGQECSGRGACPGVNGTVCVCPIEWEGGYCQRFSAGIVVFATFVLLMAIVTTQNAWKVFKPGSYDGREILKSKP